MSDAMKAAITRVNRLIQAGEPQAPTQPPAPSVHVTLESGAKPETVAALGVAIAGAIEIAQRENAKKSALQPPLPTLDLTMRVLLSYLDGGPAGAPYEEFRALENAITEWIGGSKGTAPAPASQNERSEHGID